MNKTILDYQKQERNLSDEIFVILPGAQHSSPNYQPVDFVRKISGVDNSKIIGYHFNPSYSTVCSISAKTAEFCGIENKFLEQVAIATYNSSDMLTKSKETTPSAETVQSLRAKGYRVRIAHQRLAWNKSINLGHPLMMPSWIVKKNPNWEICNFGGTTVAQVTTPEGITKEGVAVCAEPNFSRREGVKIALARCFQPNYSPFEDSQDEHESFA